MAEETKIVRTRTASKKDKQHAKEIEKRKKVFNEVKNMSERSSQALEFGNFIDKRASNPVTIDKKFVTSSQDVSPSKERKGSLKRESMFKIKEDYFIGNFGESVKSSQVKTKD